MEEEIELLGRQPYQLLTALIATEPDLSLLDVLEVLGYGKAIPSSFVWFK